jgi:xanthine dehydrogenase molybdopterin-binding subunit B
MTGDATIALDAPPMKLTRIRVSGQDELDLAARIALAGPDWQRRLAVQQTNGAERERGDGED